MQQEYIFITHREGTRPAPNLCRRVIFEFVLISALRSHFVGCGSGSEASYASPYWTQRYTNEDACAVENSRDECMHSECMSPGHGTMHVRRGHRGRWRDSIRGLGALLYKIRRAVDRLQRGTVRLLHLQHTPGSLRALRVLPRFRPAPGAGAPSLGICRPHPPRPISSWSAPCHASGQLWSTA
jgi:hypothetical protein